MGKIVSAAAMSHTFGTPDADPDASARVAAGMLEIGRRVREEKPDILLVISSDHLTNFNLDFQIPFAVGIADDFVPLGDLGTSRVKYPGNRDFATELLQYAADNGFDLAGVENINPDHGIAVPNEMINQDADIALVPLYINTVMQPTPTCARSFELGKVIRHFICARPARERVAIIATGGLSHWICMPESGRVNAQWDEQIMSLIESGRGKEIADWTPGRILAEGGNGGLEIATWACMAGALDGSKGERIFYEPMHSWWTGMGGLVMNTKSNEL
jgi:2'-aminobiphenyl-2,3-diol 1,2-dioxygenase, large subunit